MTYQKYSSYTKQLFCTNHLPLIQSRKIPYSTKSYWKKQHNFNPYIFDPTHFISNSISNLNCTIDILLDTLPKQKNKKLFWKKHLHTISKVINTCNSSADKIQILQCLNISTQAFSKWTQKPECNFSQYNLCVKKYANQLSEEEKNIIICYMQNPNFQYWNRSQIYWKMRNDKSLIISKKTFHTYCDLLQLYKSKQKKQHKKKIKGIIANRFLEKVHLDITYLGLLNNSTAYVLNIVDNFTRKLLISQASMVCDSEFVSSILQQVITKYDLNLHHTQIITDGGSENFGQVNTLLQQYPNISRIVAKKDTPHLNNIAEACHKRLKNNILPHNYFTDINHLNEKLPYYSDQYNNLPQHHLKGLTPYDAENKLLFDNNQYKELCANALQKRIAKNKMLNCCNI